MLKRGWLIGTAAGVALFLLLGKVLAGVYVDYRWFAALDQRMIQVGAERWHAHVVGIHGEGGELWIQIVPAHEPDRGVVVHCWHMQAIDEVIAALRTAHVGSGQSMLIVDTLRVM